MTGHIPIISGCTHFWQLRNASKVNIIEGMSKRSCIQCGKPLKRTAGSEEKWCPSGCFREWWLARNAFPFPMTSGTCAFCGKKASIADNAVRVNSGPEGFGIAHEACKEKRLRKERSSRGSW